VYMPQRRGLLRWQKQAHKNDDGKCDDHRPTARCVDTHGSVCFTQRWLGALRCFTRLAFHNQHADEFTHTLPPCSYAAFPSSVPVCQPRSATTWQESGQHQSDGEAAHDHPRQAPCLLQLLNQQCAQVGL
jgi:hypothetical protein